MADNREMGVQFALRGPMDNTIEELDKLAQLEKPTGMLARDERKIKGTKLNLFLFEEFDGASWNSVHAKNWEENP